MLLLVTWFGIVAIGALPLCEIIAKRRFSR
jgi:hypothetical protein